MSEDICFACRVVSVEDLPGRHQSLSKCKTVWVQSPKDPMFFRMNLCPALPLGIVDTAQTCRQKHTTVEMHDCHNDPITRILLFTIFMPPFCVKWSTIIWHLVSNAFPSLAGGLRMQCFLFGFWALFVFLQIYVFSLHKIFDGLGFRINPFQTWKLRLKRWLPQPHNKVAKSALAQIPT